jgi:hypothetical protein
MVAFKVISARISGRRGIPTAARMIQGRGGFYSAFTFVRFLVL